MFAPSVVARLRSVRVGCHDDEARLVKQLLDDGKWVRQVQAQRNYTVDWRFISLRLVNAGVDYDAHFPPEYEAGHPAGLRLLRTAARARAEHGRESILADAGLPLDMADALDDASRDAEIQDETDEALSLTGKDVGTRILHFEPPTGVAFFGPVISRLLAEDTATELWDHVVGLARFPGFAELKRSLRERPQLVALGIDTETAGQQEDWHGGSRRQK